MLYLIAIFVLMAGLCTVDIFVMPALGFNAWFLSMPWFVILSVIINVVAVIAVDGLFAFLIRRLPAKWFNHKKKLFIVSAGEKKFYEKIKIRKWKDKVPELGQFTDFSKNEIAEPRNNKYLDRYFLEACYGEVIHFSSLFLGFLIIFIYPLGYWLCFGFPIAVANIFFNLPSLFILRYNSTKLRVLYTSNERREMRERQAAAAEQAQVTNE